MNNRANWRRPNLPVPLDPSKDAILFQQIEIDHYADEDVVEEYGGVVRSAPVFRLFGCTGGQQSVVCRVHGFFPYFYIPAPDQFQPADLELIQRACQVKKNAFYFSNMERFIG